MTDINDTTLKLPSDKGSMSQFASQALCQIVSNCIKHLLNNLFSTHTVSATARTKIEKLGFAMANAPTFALYDYLLAKVRVLSPESATYLNASKKLFATHMFLAMAPPVCRFMQTTINSSGEFLCGKVFIVVTRIMSWIIPK